MYVPFVLQMHHGVLPEQPQYFARSFASLPNSPPSCFYEFEHLFLLVAFLNHLWTLYF